MKSSEKVEKQASSEIAQSRERNVNHATCNCHECTQARWNKSLQRQLETALEQLKCAERDTRELCAQLVEKLGHCQPADRYGAIMHQACRDLAERIRGKE